MNSENNRLRGQQRNGGLAIPYNTGLVFTCFEHQRLDETDFSHLEDFEFLIEQELACFRIEVIRGKLSLMVLHYLAKIVLPSGISLEILPKISRPMSNESKTPEDIYSSQDTNSSKDANLSKKIEPDDESKLSQRTRSTDNHTYLQKINASKKHARDSEIGQARIWVNKMLADIAGDNLTKWMPAINLELSSENTINSVHSQLASLAVMPNISSSILNNGKRTVNQDISPLPQSDQPWYHGLLILARDKIYQASDLIPHTYQTQVSNNPSAQGKLNLSAQLKKNWHRPHYLYNEKAVFKADKTLLKFLLTAWYQLQQLQDPDNNDRLIPPALQSVDALRPSQWSVTYQNIYKNKHIWQTQFTIPQREALVEAVEWGWWLLSHGTLISSDGVNTSSKNRLPTPALMINMNHAFERWVLGKLALMVKRTLPDSELIIHPSFDWLMTDDPHLSSDNLINNVNSDTLLKDEHTSDRKDISQPSKVVQKLIPDACIRSADGQISHVIDIKYKAIQRIQQVSGSDWQQLSVYQSHLKCEQAWLIYPISPLFTHRIDVQNYSMNNNFVHHAGRMTLSAVPFDINEGKIII